MAVRMASNYVLLALFLSAALEPVVSSIDASAKCAAGGAACDRIESETVSMLQKGLKTNERKAPRTDGLAQVAEGYYGSDSTSVVSFEPPLPAWKPLCGIKCPSGQIASEDLCSCTPLKPLPTLCGIKCPPGQIASMRKAPGTDGLAQVAEGYYGSDSTSVASFEPEPYMSETMGGEDLCSCMCEMCGLLVPAEGPLCLQVPCPGDPMAGPPELELEPWMVGGCAGTKFGCCPEDSWYPEEAAWGPKGKGCYDFRDPMDALQKTAKEQQQDENASPTEKKADQEKRIADQKEKKADQKKRL